MKTIRNDSVECAGCSDVGMGSRSRGGHFLFDRGVDQSNHGFLPAAGVLRVLGPSAAVRQLLVSGLRSGSWRPYSNGYWTWTDDGWYWESDEPWAWACYHYGRWAYDPYYGWLWVPGTVWGPSWVAWREGGDYVGWAPLPPNCDFGPGGVIVGASVTIAPSAFVFVGVHHFCEPIRPSLLVVNNTTIINKTVNITRITYANKTVINHGPDLQEMQKVVGHRIETVSVRNLRQGEMAQPIAGRVEERSRTGSPFSSGSTESQQRSWWSRAKRRRSTAAPSPVPLPPGLRHPCTIRSTGRRRLRLLQT